MRHTLQLQMSAGHIFVRHADEHKLTEVAGKVPTSAGGAGPVAVGVRLLDVFAVPHEEAVAAEHALQPRLAVR